MNPAAKAAVDQEWEKLEKIQAWDLTKVRGKKEVIDEARTKGEKIHCASLMDICHLKNAELETKHQESKGRVVLRGDIVKQYSLNKDHRHLKCQQQKSWIIISRLPRCAGQAEDAVSAHTQVKMEDAPTSLKNSKIGKSRHLDSSTTTQMANIMVQYGRPSRSSWAKYHFFGEVVWYPRTWISGIWSSQFLTETRIRVIKNGETRAL